MQTEHLELTLEKVKISLGREIAHMQGRDMQTTLGAESSQN